MNATQDPVLVEKQQVIQPRKSGGGPAFARTVYTTLALLLTATLVGLCIALA